MLALATHVGEELASLKQEADRFVSNATSRRHAGDCFDSLLHHGDWALAVAGRAKDDLCGAVPVVLAKHVPLQVDAKGRERSGVFNLVIAPFIYPRMKDTSKIRSDLLDAAIRECEQRLPELPLLCLVLQSSTAMPDDLEERGFKETGQICSDGSTAELLGFSQTSPPRLRAFQRDGAKAPGRARAAIVEAANQLVLLSDSGITAIEPTLEFWARMPHYACHSAYPILPDVIEDILDSIDVADSLRSLTVVPCAGGDLLTAFDHAVPGIEQLQGIDIRQDLLDLLRTRCEHGEFERLVFEFIRGMASSPDARAAQAHIRKFSRAIELEDGVFCDDAQRLLWRLFNEVTRSRAVPDWWFPLRAFAAALSGSPSQSSLQMWQELVDSSRLQGGDYDTSTPSNRLKTLCANLCQPLPLDSVQQTDLVLSWEAVHMFGDDEELDMYIQNLNRLRRPGGKLVITAIRESSDTVPVELRRAREKLSDLGEGVPRVMSYHYDVSANSTGSALSNLVSTYWYLVYPQGGNQRQGEML